MKNIIVVDMQKGFMTKSNLHLVEKINNYLRQNNFDNIFFTKCINNCDSPFTKILNWNGVTKHEDQEIVCDIPKGAKILIKDCYGLSAENINLLKNYAKGDITEIEICGTDTDACCLAIAFNLLDNNIKPIILSDLCASSSSNKDIHSYALKIMERQFGSENVK